MTDKKKGRKMLPSPSLDRMVKQPPNPTERYIFNVRFGTVVVKSGETRP